MTGFRRKVYENCILLGYYADSSGNFLPTFRDKLSVTNFGFLTPEEITDRSPRNVDKKLYYSLRNDPEERSSEKACFEIPIAEGHPNPGMAIPVLMEDI